MCCFDFKQALDNLNYSMRYGIVKDHINSAVHNVMMNVKYTFLESHGPRRGKVTEDEPLVPRSVVRSRNCDEAMVERRVGWTRYWICRQAERQTNRQTDRWMDR